MRRVGLLATLIAGAAVSGCARSAARFGDAVALLRRHTDVIVLSDPGGNAQVAVCPALQGRVMTSTLDGPGGPSFGWINFDLVASGRLQAHINAYGGEDRFWLGPEGGQFSLFFAKGAPFELEQWYTPAPIDSVAYPVVSRTKERILFRKRMKLTNYSDTEFEVDLHREVRLLSASEAWKALGIRPVEQVKMVAFASENKIRNVGDAAWKKETGLLSVWILGMFNPSPSTTVVIPFQKGSEAERGPVVNDAYFGKVPEDRLATGDGVIFFKGDGNYRSKIGLTPRRARPVMGSWDASLRVLTLVHFDLPEGATDYVNSMWKIQDNPYGGDAVNSYNDGPPEPGKDSLGPFYELESSSPAAALGRGDSLVHVHRTIHFMGNRNRLDTIARRALGVTLDEIEAAFSGK